MLKRLTISNYALIDVLDIEFPEHLVIITGDSGAGKSILLGALSLLLGGKYDGSVLKDASRNCVVEAEFDDCIVRRVVTAAGRSRVFINDEPATLEQVRSLASGKIDIHSQNSQLLLGSEDFCLSVVDAYAGNAALLDEYRKAYAAHQELSSRLAKLREERAARERERDYVKFRYNQLVAANLQQGELEQIEEQQKTLANAGQIKASLSFAADALATGEQSVEQSLKDVGRSLQKIADCYPAASELWQRIESCRIELKDISDTLESGQEKIDASDEALQRVESRIALIYDLMHRNDVATEEDLIAVRDGYAKELDLSDSLSQEEERLVADLDRADALCGELSQRLGERRSAAVEPLSALLQDAIRELDMPKAQFRAQLVRLPQRGRSGAESVRFMFDSTGSGRFTEAGKTASGGEMSRIMLCIKALMASHADLPTIIFDEIDTGMSGSLADKVGRKIVEIGNNMQVIAITHLPQVAAKGGAHYLVYKEYMPEGAVSHIRRIEGEDRVGEIARMISGSSISAEALAAARVLLKEAN